jgi:predicted Zn finger-like uncharacterized protein
MSLITRCPACGTMFKVVPDQLKISEGWVRCGHCADVFEATAHLQADVGPPEVAVPPKAASSAPTPQPVARGTGDNGPESDDFGSSLNTEIDEGVAFDAPDSVQLEAEALALVEQPLDRPFELRRRDNSELESPRPQADPAAALKTGAQSDSDAHESEPDVHDEVSFVREARQKAFWERPRTRAGLLFSVIVLAILLALQIAVHDRDRLATASPALRPWLARLCEPLKCRIGPPRQIDAIAIDSSSFNKLRADAYRLNVTLKNQGGIAVAMPALELTLTDVQDQAVVRRVLMPAELGAAASVIAPSSEWAGSLALAVAANGTGARIAGYRLLAFYP